MSLATDHKDVRALLGGARRVRTRVRGFAPWAPRGATLELLEQVRAVLAEYEDYLPLTIRQIFYRLVGVHEYEKTEKAYARLCEHLNRARRAHLIPMDAIRDDGGVISEPNGWESAEQFTRTVRAMAANFKLDHSAGQKSRQVVICEAAGMVPQLERVAHPLGATVMSGGGFDSLTDKHKFAAELAGHGRPTQVLHIGDHDPSGAHMFLAILEDIEAFTRELGGNVTFTPSGRDARADRPPRPTDRAKKVDGQARVPRHDMPGRGARARRARRHPARCHRRAHRPTHLRARPAARANSAPRTHDPSGGRAMNRVEYLLAELRCAALRARLWQADIESIGTALKPGWISPEQAVEVLADCDCLQLIEPKEPAA